MAVVEEPDFPALVAEAVEEPESTQIERAAAVSKATIDSWIPEGTVVPEEVYIEAVVSAGSSIFYRRTARNGIVAFGDIDGGSTPMRLPRDDFTHARTLLAPWVGRGIG